MSRSVRRSPFRFYGNTDTRIILRRRDRRRAKHLLRVTPHDDTPRADRHSSKGLYSYYDGRTFLGDCSAHARCRAIGEPCYMDGADYGCYIFGSWGPYERKRWKDWGK